MGQVIKFSMVQEVKFFMVPEVKFSMGQELLKHIFCSVEREKIVKREFLKREYPVNVFAQTQTAFLLLPMMLSSFEETWYTKKYF